MNVMNTDADSAFRQMVSRFVRENLPAATRDCVRAGRRLSRQQLCDWYGLLHGRGWATPRWPAEWGGTSWTEAQHAIFDEEIHRLDAPRMVSPGILMLGPTLIRYGRDEQKARYLPGIQASSTWWAQGFSEPEAGSDLASVTTTATARLSARGQTTYIVNGRKIWTSYAHFSDKIFCLVRTAPRGDRPQSGLILLLVDMRSPGIGIRRLETIDGGDDLNEVTFDDVEVQDRDLVGREGDGWRYAKYLLSFERNGIAGIAAAKKLLARLRDIGRWRRDSGRGSSWLDMDIARLTLELVALEATSFRMSAPGASDASSPSILKVRGTELRQELVRKLYEHSDEGLFWDAVARPSNSPSDPRANIALSLLDLRKLSIYGGTNEIQRNIIARQIFGS